VTQNVIFVIFRKLQSENGDLENGDLDGDVDPTDKDRRKKHK